MPDLYFEDFVAGAPLPEAVLTVVEDDAASFAAAFGPGAPCPGEGREPPPVSGWHVAALGMRLLFDAVLHRTAGLGAPGIEAVTWPHRVRVGDALRFTGRVVEVRRSASRPDMGLVTLAISIVNQRSVCVMTQQNVVMVARRGRDPRRDGTEAGA